MKLFLSDVDGTLIFDDIPSIQEEDVQAIKAYQNGGNLFGLVTGRDAAFCENLLNLYKIKADCLITCNGAISYWKDKEFDSVTISNQRSYEIFEKLKGYSQIVAFYSSKSGDNYFLNSVLEDFEAVKEELASLGRLNDLDVMDFLNEFKEDCAKISVYCRTKEVCDFYLPIFQREFNDLEVMQTSYNYIEFTQKGCDKARAMQQLMNYAKLSNEEIAFIGDGFNDVPLFCMLENTYVMEQADIEVKKNAKVVVKGAAQALEMERMK